MVKDSGGEGFAGPINEIFRGNSPLRALAEFSKDGQLDPGTLDTASIEAASMAFLLNGANDIHPPEMGLAFGKKDEALTREHVRLAAIRTNHFDILPKKPRNGMSEHDFPLAVKVCDQTGQTQILINTRASDKHYFDKKKWINTRLTHLRSCLENRSNIICMGEFDFPPFVERDSFASEFSAAVLNEINSPSVDFPVFVVAGSRHESVDRDGAKYCSNRAKIFVNDILDTRKDARSEPIRYPIDHDKIVSAEKAGEWLDTPRNPRLRYYDTRLGRIGVLICVDAYSPNVIFSLINNRSVHSQHKLDYLLIPSYNMSPIFSYACQILSLTCETTVLLVDACKVSASKPVGVALYVGGRLFSDIVEDGHGEEGPVGQFVCNPPPESQHEGSYSRIWELNLDYVRAKHLGKFSGTPFFNLVDPFLSFLKYREERKQK